MVHIDHVTTLKIQANIDAKSERLCRVHGEGGGGGGRGVLCTVAYYGYHIFKI